MKNVLFLFIAIGAISCKKDPVEPGSPVTPQPVIPATPGLNYYILNGDGHVNDTFWIGNYQTGQRIDSLGVTRVIGVDSVITCGFYLDIPGTVADTFDIAMSNQSSIWTSNTGGDHYNVYILRGAITRYDSVGGLIEGRMSGTCLNGVSMQAASYAGVFSVVRQ